jgi:hypothetical protein
MKGLWSLDTRGYPPVTPKAAGKCTCGDLLEEALALVPQRPEDASNGGDWPTLSVGDVKNWLAWNELVSKALVRWFDHPGELDTGNC